MDSEKRDELIIETLKEAINQTADLRITVRKTKNDGKSIKIKHRQSDKQFVIARNFDQGTYWIMPVGEQSAEAFHIEDLEFFGKMRDYLVGVF